MADPTKIIYKNRVDWHQRDIELSDITSKLLDQQVAKVSRTELDRVLGGHGWLTKYKAKLPITMKVYTRYVHRIV